MENKRRHTICRMFMMYYRRRCYKTLVPGLRRENKPEHTLNTTSAPDLF